jgi:DNA-binding CsgD family transcriptional regulator
MESIIIPKEFPCFTKVGDIHTLCEPLIANSPVGAFTYGRAYQDGHIFVLSTYTEFQKYLFLDRKGKICISFDLFDQGRESSLFTKDSEKRKSWLMTEICNDSYWPNIWRSFNLGSVLCIFEKVTDYYEFFYFSSCDNSNIVNFYLNNYSILAAFMLHFKERGADLIEIAEKNKVFLPYRSPQYRKMLLSLQMNASAEEDQILKLYDKLKLNKYPICYRGCKSYLTPRELGCIQILSQGSTFKEIGRALNISPRTAEKHLENVKERLGVISTNTVLDIYRTSFLSDIMI